jgi:hypothetical protein
MVRVDNEHRTKYLRATGFAGLRVVPGGLDSHALCSKVRWGDHRRAPLKPIKSNNVVLVSAIASLVVLFVLLELHIRALTDHSLSRRQPLGELKSQIEGMDARTVPRLDACCVF